MQKPVRYKTGSIALRQVWEIIGDQATRQIWTEALGQVLGPVTNQVRDGVRDPIWGSIWKQVYRQIRSSNNAREDAETN